MRSTERTTTQLFPFRAQRLRRAPRKPLVMGGGALAARTLTIRRLRRWQATRVRAPVATARALATTEQSFVGTTTERRGLWLTPGTGRSGQEGARSITRLGRTGRRDGLDALGGACPGFLREVRRGSSTRMTRVESRAGREAHGGESGIVAAEFASNESATCWADHRTQYIAKVMVRLWRQLLARGADGESIHRDASRLVAPSAPRIVAVRV